MYCINFNLNIMFLVHHPSNAVLKSPPNLGLYGTRNFYVSYRDENEDKNITLGAWHILPNYIAKKFSKELKLTEVNWYFFCTIVKKINIFYY